MNLSEFNTEELEILGYGIDGIYFGLSVHEIIEIMVYIPVSPEENVNSAIEGTIMLRDEVVTVIDMASYLDLNESADKSKDRLIIVEVNKHKYAFHIHTISEVNRVAMSDVKKPEDSSYGKHAGIISGVIKARDHMLTVLDFEKIISEIQTY